MLRKIVTKNVGVLRAFATPDSPELSKLTLIYARNGRGKTTLSSVLRASMDGDALTVRGRRTLGSDGVPPEVTLIFDKGENVRFTGNTWTRQASTIEVFDTAFIADNLHAGEKVALGHDRGLFRVILGRGGVKLARQQERLNEKAKRRADALKRAEAALNDDVPSGMTLEEFLGHAPSTTIEGQIEDSRRQLRSIQQAERMTKIKLLEPISVPSLPMNVGRVLTATIADIQSLARERLAEHYAKHKLGKDGEAWLRFGREHIVDDECPFCGREGADELGLVTLYDQIFGERYQFHLTMVKEAAEAIDAALGSEAREHIARITSLNLEAAREWGEFCNLQGVAIPEMGETLSRLQSAHGRVKPLVDAKRQRPLEVVDREEELKATAEELDEAAQTIRAYNEAVEAINLLAEKRRSGAHPNEMEARARLEGLVKQKRRTEPGVQARVDAMLLAKTKDARVKDLRIEVQQRLKKANQNAATHYHDRVNHYLQRFGTTFVISAISNSMQGNLGSVDYGLVVRGHPVSRGRKGAEDGEPTFGNTLSSGDKTTLAFAFFLAGLDRDAGLTGKIIVFDDPLSSHDTHRQGQTVELVSQICGRSEQVIVLSHDEHFLRRLSKRCATVPKVAYEIKGEGQEQWSSATIVDLDELCRSRHAVLVADLKAYHDKRIGEPTHIAPAVRKVLETHYRGKFSAYFKGNDLLGKIIEKIRESGPDHPCFVDLPELESCNAATKGEHHGDDPNVALAAPIDPDELNIVVTDCLHLIGALRRPSKATSAIAAVRNLIAAPSGD